MPLILLILCLLESWITLSDDGLSFVKREFLDSGFSTLSEEEIDFVTLCSELSESYVFLFSPKQSC